MKYLKVFLIIVVCLSLQGCWFFYVEIPRPVDTKKTMTWTEANEYIKKKNLEARDEAVDRDKGTADKP